jgi:4-amino-4-deoxy-L-arabinose transferase-like glycosyltransferase
MMRPSSALQATVMCTGFLIVLVCFGLAASHRFIDGDEGFYLLASRLVMHGQPLYAGFFFTQAPLLPYVYGAWTEIFGRSWLTARMLAGLLSSALAIMLFAQVREATGRLAAGAAAVVLLVSSGMVLASFPAVKTYSLASVPLFGCFMILSRDRMPVKRAVIVAAGVLLGLSVSTRSYLVAVLPVFLGWIVFRVEAPARPRVLIAFLVGFVAGTLPLIVPFVMHPQETMFDNLGYHAIRTNAGLIGDFRQKIQVLEEILLGRADGGWQFTGLGVVATFGLSRTAARRGAAMLAWLIAAVLGTVSLLPTPTIVHYFSMCVPYLIVSAVCGADAHVSRRNSVPARGVAAAVGLAMILFVVSAVPGIRANFVVGYPVLGIRDAADAENWTLARVSAVSAAIDEIATPGEPVASLWPGYLFTTAAAPYPGYENDFGWTIADRLSEDQRQTYRISSLADAQEDFGNHVPRVVVLGNQYNSGVPPVSVYMSLLMVNGYEVRRVVGDTWILVCCGAGAVGR